MAPTPKAQTKVLANTISSTERKTSWERRTAAVSHAEDGTVCAAEKETSSVVAVVPPMATFATVPIARTNRARAWVPPGMVVMAQTVIAVATATASQS